MHSHTHIVFYFCLVWCVQFRLGRQEGEQTRKALHTVTALLFPFVPQLWGPQVCHNPLFTCFINVGLWDFQRNQVGVPCLGAGDSQGVARVHLASQFPPH